VEVVEEQRRRAAFIRSTLEGSNEVIYEGTLATRRPRRRIVEANLPRAIQMSIAYTPSSY
jgi:hypothetical protein